MQSVVLPLLLVVCVAEEAVQQKRRLLESSEPVNREKFKEKAWVPWDEQARKENPKSNMMLTAQDIEKVNAEHTTGAMKDVGPLDDYLDLWYVNLKEGKDRRECMDKQIAELGVKSHRFQGFNFKRCESWEADDITRCLTKKKYPDCIGKKGIAFGITTHGSASNTDNERKYHIVSNWCSHKRMMAQMYKEHQQQKSKKKYAIMMEDDVAFNRKEFMRKVVNFCETYDGKYNKTWTMVQIDPFGSKCDKHIVGHFEGLPVWKPKNVNNGWACSNYWGAQALLIKYDAIPEIIQHMEEHETVPLDWLPGKLETGLAWRANIALNPEASRSVHMKVPLPQYCKRSVQHSTIGFRQKTTARAFSLAEKTGENPLDVKHDIDEVTVDPAQDENYAKLVEQYQSYDPKGTYLEWIKMQEKARTDLKKYGI